MKRLLFIYLFTRRESRGSADDVGVAIQHTIMLLSEKLTFCSAICRLLFFNARQRYKPQQFYSLLQHTQAKVVLGQHYSLLRMNS